MKTIKNVYFISYFKTETNRASSNIVTLPGWEVTPRWRRPRRNMPAASRALFLEDSQVLNKLINDNYLILSQLSQRLHTRGWFCCHVTGSWRFCRCDRTSTNSLHLNKACQKLPKKHLFSTFVSSQCCPYGLAPAACRSTSCTSRSTGSEQRRTPTDPWTGPCLCSTSLPTAQRCTRFSDIYRCILYKYRM